MGRSLFGQLSCAPTGANYRHHSDARCGNHKQEAQLDLLAKSRVRADQLALGAIALGAVVMLSGSADSPIKCPVHALTGLHCPGCGGQRAVQELLEGDLLGALGQNALMFTAPVFIALLPLSKSRRWLEYIIIGSAGVLTLAFVVFRNQPGSPLAPN